MLLFFVVKTRTNKLLVGFFLFGEGGLFCFGLLFFSLVVFGGWEAGALCVEFSLYLLLPLLTHTHQ